MHESTNEPGNALEPLLASRQAADFLGVTEAALEKWRRTGEGPAFVRIGRLARYEPDALRVYVDQRRCSSTADLKKRQSLPRRA